MKQVIICHVNGHIIGVATSEKQKIEIAKMYFDDNRGEHQVVQFTYVKTNIYEPLKRQAVGGVKDKLLSF